MQTRWLKIPHANRIRQLTRLLHHVGSDVTVQWAYAAWVAREHVSTWFEAYYQLHHFMRRICGSNEHTLNEHPNGSNEHSSGTNEHSSGSNELSSGTNEHPNGSNEHPNGSNEHSSGTNGHSNGFSNRTNGFSNRTNGFSNRTNGLTITMHHTALMTRCGRKVLNRFDQLC